MLINTRAKALAAAIGAAAFIGAAAGLSSSEGQTTPQPPPAAESGYIVREYRGMVAVFTPAGELLDLTESPVAVLPQADRTSLEEGIRVEDDRQLAMLLEDLQG